MDKLLKGLPVSESLIEQMKIDVSELKKKGVIPTLAIIRVGEKENDIAYEKGILKRCEQVGIAVEQVLLPLDITQDDLEKELSLLNEAKNIHGILIFRPLPKHLDDDAIRDMMSPSKDVDGCTDMSLAGVFTGSKVGFAPCTAEAAVKILEYYGIEVEGKKVAVIGRSLVIGRPVAMMLMEKGATPVICHTKTKDVEKITREADIIIAASGRSESIGRKYLSAGQVVIDVGITWNEEKNKLTGDLSEEDAKDILKAYTPVPGGVGAVTTSVLALHVVKAAKMCS